MNVDDKDALPQTREEKVARMAAIKAEEARLKSEYEELRDEVTPDLDEAQFFIDENGVKRVAYRVSPENTVVNAELLASYVSEEVINEVTERKVKTPAFWQAVKAGRIDESVAARVAKLVPATPHVRFGDPSDLARRA